MVYDDEDNIFKKGKEKVVEQYNKPINEFKGDIDTWKGVVEDKKKEAKDKFKVFDGGLF